MILYSTTTGCIGWKSHVSFFLFVLHYVGWLFFSSFSGRFLTFTMLVFLFLSTKYLNITTPGNRPIMPIVPGAARFTWSKFFEQKKPTLYGLWHNAGMMMNSIKTYTHTSHHITLTIIFNRKANIQLPSLNTDKWKSKTNQILITKSRFWKEKC